MGLKAVSFAKLIGVSPNHYWRVERGERRLSLDKLREAARVLGVTLAELLDGAASISRAAKAAKRRRS